MIVLSIGSNLGDRMAHLRSVVDAVRPWLVTASPVYETPPWGPVPQGPFLNAVLLCEGGGDPWAWLERAHEIENAADRRREVRWGPRTLDVDLVAADGVEQDDPDLTLPHPRAGERAFVLVPWLAADPSAELGGRPLGEWLAALPAEERDAVVRVDGAVLA